MAKRRKVTKRALKKPKRPAKSTAVTRAIDWKPAFLACLKRTGHVGTASDEARIARATAYDHREIDEAFSEAWATALASHAPRRLDRLEEELEDRIVRGIPEPVVRDGKLVHVWVDEGGQYVEDALVEAAVKRGVKLKTLKLKRVPLVVYKKEFAPLAMALKAANRAKYSDRVQVQHDGKLDVVRSAAEGTTEAAALLAELSERLGLVVAGGAAEGEATP